MFKYPIHCPKLCKYTKWNLLTLYTSEFQTGFCGRVLAYSQDSQLLREVDIIHLWILKIYDVLFGVYTIFTQISEFSSKNEILSDVHFYSFGFKNHKTRIKKLPFGIFGQLWQPDWAVHRTRTWRYQVVDQTLIIGLAWVWGLVESWLCGLVHKPVEKGTVPFLCFKMRVKISWWKFAKTLG